MHRRSGRKFGSLVLSQSLHLVSLSTPSHTIHEHRFIGTSSLSHIFTWIDAAYAVHVNGRSHTGGTISMGYDGYGIVHGRSSMQKINVKSSTEAELVGVAEYIPYNIW